MPTYRYMAKEATGKTVSGILEYSDKALLIDALRKKGLVIISINETAKKKPARSSKKVKLDEIVIFSRQLATMVDSGIPLVQAMDILHEQIEKPVFKNVIAAIRDDIETGASFSDALCKHPAVFSPLYINMVKAGESSGSLDDILDRLASYLEKANVLQRKVKTSLVYPAAVVTMAILITLVMLLKVIPTFKGIFSMLGGTLPFPTRVLILVSDTLRSMFIYVVIVLAAVIFALKKFLNTKQGRIAFDMITLKLPIIGELLRKVAVAKFTRTLATLVKSGVPILVSLEIVGKTSGNTVIEKALNDVRVSIKEGENIADPLAKSGVFPPMVVRMIHVGEQTGELEKMLGKIADFYDDQVDAAVSGMTSLIEPLIISFLGVVIGGIVIAMFLPVFKMTELISR
ncbi:MAG: type II secretion system F family protein [Candidatus Omnitrophica bacterium]|nr:type II secretion system F family protein [Candidatus Omnitrophota bacterium]MBU4149002.1 type II secretion system F family protein [Candidatus Omnitrophota bacterium]